MTILASSDRFEAFAGQRVTVLDALKSWPRRRWLVAASVAVLGGLAAALTTAMIPNPIFGREVPTTWWAWPTLFVASLLAGLVTATYVRTGVVQTTKGGVVGGFLSYLAVGCPVCNKLALLALGYTGALQYFAPVQPLLAVGGVILLAWALRARVRGEVACAVPA